MPAFTAQYQFAASFTVFLVALAGFALVVLREGLTTRAGARLALGAGFVGLGTGAFLEGALLLDDEAWALPALRVVGVLALYVGSGQWRGSDASRRLLWAGCAALVAAVPLELVDRPNVVATVAALGGLLVGAALLAASRVAIAARVAASAAATLLLVVLVLSVALSAVLGRTVEDQALADLDDRAVTEAGAVEAEVRSAVDKVAVVADLMADVPVDDDDPTSPRLLSQIDQRTGPTPDQQAAVQAELDRIRRDIFQDLGFAYVTETERVIGGTAMVVAAARTDIVTSTLAASDRSGQATTEVVGGRGFIVGVAPINLGAAPIGAVVGVRPLDAAYLTVRAAGGAADGVILLDAEGRVVASSTADLPSRSRLRGLALGALVDGDRGRVRLFTEDQFAAARPVRSGDGSAPDLVVMTVRSTDQVEDVRKDLFRTFFVIAFGGTVLALLLAALVGDRIGAGIRRLTTSAEAIQRGELGVRSGVRSEDEVGVLGATFDSMAASIEEQTDELQQAAQRVQAIVAGMGEALLALDADGCITDFNEAAEDLFDLNVSEARGRPVHDVVVARSDDGADLTARLRALEPGRWSALGVVVAAEGEQVPVAMTAGALRGPDGDVTGAVVVLRDLRGEREVERMKRHFLSRVGHELRTPLTPLVGYSRMLAGRELPPDRARFVYDSILASAKRLERIVEMLEFFASLDAGRQVLRSEPVDVRALLTDVVTRLGPPLEGSSHLLSRRVARDVPDVVADGRWLARSIDELVDNAVKFSPSGGRVVVSAGRWAEDPSLVEIAVRDSGVGMSPEQVDAAFTEWAQGDESDTRSFGGLGLGLALVQRVAEHHGGRIVCATVPGKGSKFSILLPAQDRAHRRVRPERSPSAEGASS
ncbi:MAG TPA: ATP-binding protein [Acidimicrobiales bacterium]|nr:ATP-binding protein [Acidimicrobiales bacterium]